MSFFAITDPEVLSLLDFFNVDSDISNDFVQPSFETGSFFFASRIENHSKKCNSDGCVLTAIVNMRKRTNTPLQESDFCAIQSGSSTIQGCYEFDSFFDDVSWESSHSDDLNHLIMDLGVKWSDFGLTKIEYEPKIKNVDICAVRTLDKLAGMFELPKHLDKANYKVEKEWNRYTYD